MNFKRNLLVITSALVGAIKLSSCLFDGQTSFKRFSFIEEKEDTHQDVSGAGYIKYGDYASYSVQTNEGKQELGSAYKVIRDHGGENHLPSIGEQKIIVVPVQFSDYKVEKLGLTDSQFIECLNKAFFGVSSNNAYVSVSEYFNRSSYGKLKLSGKVCDKIYDFPLSTSEIKEKGIKREVLAQTYYSKVVEWYKSNYSDLGEYAVGELPNGKNIPIYMVYTYPSESEEKGENFFWAYTFSDIPLSWSSSSFMYLNYGEPDSHTFIHETGHLFGLLDYYPNIIPETKEDEEPMVIPDPAGRIDMMDCSIGDETSFSKMYLNWARPYQITDSCDFTVKSFGETGDVLLLANEWNKTVFDEYYLVEFYTPTNLNTYDVSFGNSQAKLPTVPGIKIYHVDARLAYVDSRKKPDSYCEMGFGIPSKNNMGFAHDNNTYKEPDKFQKNYLYELKLNHSNEMISGCATNDNLYRAGDVIENLPLNKGGTLNYKIVIKDLQFGVATIKFEKIEISEK